ncbi:MAG: 3'(2'),5'-bisphosphate nucleotidase CysQ [Nitrospirae bacterium]|nr:MAG: 3'(2'),5'-bisphosphate nucleotidase CysQ [Nitrospirota bacterium]
MTSTLDLAEELTVAVQLAKEAGALIMEIYATDFTVAYKGKGDPVTEADRRANTLIVEGLRQRFPWDLIVAEESPVPVVSNQVERIWYVDPLDGTREFIAKNGEFAVMIGLAIHGQARLGVVFGPDKGILYSGVVGQGAWMEVPPGEPRPVQVSDKHKLSNLGLVVSRSHRHARLDQIREHLGVAQEIPCGSVGLKVGLIVQQIADLYVEPGPYTSAWDSCGPEAILKGAGGQLTNLLGEPLRYQPGNLKNTQGLVATNGKCHGQVIEALSPLVHQLGLRPARA